MELSVTVHRRRVVALSSLLRTSTILIYCYRSASAILILLLLQVAIARFGDNFIDIALYPVIMVALCNRADHYIFAL